MSKLFTVVTWPESQTLLEIPSFKNHSYLINDDLGLSEFGPGSYFVEVDWLGKILETHR